MSSARARGAPVGKPAEDARELLRLFKEQMEHSLGREAQAVEELERRAREARDRIKARRRILRTGARHARRVRVLAERLGLAPDREVTPVPPLPAGHREVDFVTVEEGLAYVRISRDEASGLYTYEALEPPLTPREREALGFIRETLVRTMPARPPGQAEGGWEDRLREAVDRIVLDYSILVDEVSLRRLHYHLRREFLGYGPIEVMMEDPLIEDISCDGPGIPIYIFHREFQSVRSNVAVPTEQELDRFVIRLAQVGGKSISIAEPLLDATLPNGSRLQATLSREVTTRGSSFTIRKYRADPLTPPDLVRTGTIDAGVAALLWLAMEGGRNMIIAGGTASGKTTTLNAAALFIPPQRKVVSIEDTREINLPHENWVAGLTRKGFGGEQAGEIDMYRLLEAALRQRPEYLLVGEVRGPEANTLFQAMATGHATYSTMHADSASSAVYRLENPPIGVPRMMLQHIDLIAIQAQVRVGDRLQRRIKEVVELVGLDPETGDLLTNTVFRWDPSRDRHEYLGKCHALEAIAGARSWDHARMEQEWRDRARVVRWMAARGVRHYKDVWRVVTAYYANPQAVLARVEQAAAEAGGGAPDGGLGPQGRNP